MQQNDISFVYEQQRFNFRVGAIICTAEQMLLQKAKQDDFYTLVGGRVKFGESTLQAILREINEELGVIFQEQDLSLNWVVENFFTYQQLAFHELLFLYRIVLPMEHPLVAQQSFTCIDKPTATMQWIQTQAIKNLELRPAFLKKHLHIHTLQYLLNKQ